MFADAHISSLGYLCIKPEKTRIACEQALLFDLRLALFTFVWPWLGKCGSMYSRCRVDVRWIIIYEGEHLEETVYELSRSRRNEASFKAKAKRTTTKNKTNRKKQRKSNSSLRGYRKIAQTGKDYLLFLVIERRKRICNSQSKD